MGVLYSSLNLRGSNSFTNNCRGALTEIVQVYMLWEEEFTPKLAP